MAKKAKRGGGATARRRTQALRRDDEGQPAPSSYLQPPARRTRAPRLAAGLGAAPAAGIAVRGMEVTQVVQSLNNTVRLIAGKPTVVRVYLDPQSFAGATTLTAEITWGRDGGGAVYWPAMNRIRINPTRPLGIADQRFNIEQSINFRLPDEATATGDIELQLNRVMVPGGADLPLTPQPKIRLTFRSAPPLRIRVVGLRYRNRANPPATVTPDAIHFSALRSYLLRAYPVSALEWSQIVIDGNARLMPPFDPPNRTATAALVNAQLSALRGSEVFGADLAGVGTPRIDSRTHYFGLVDVDDKGPQRNFMRGQADYNEQTKEFQMVASGPCGVPNGWSGDNDRSFADWYGAHELGHTFQRRHPGFPLYDPIKEMGQPHDPDEMGFPYPDGLISTPDNMFVGFDIGDPSLDLPMRALPGNVYHDVMTYADNQWLSAHTYEAIHDRLLLEDELFAPQLA